MTNLMTDRMTSWIILWLIQMVKSGKFHTCNVFFKVLFLKHFAIHFRSAFARMKRRRYTCEIYENIDWYWHCWLKSISLLLLNWWFQPGCTAFWISLTLAPGYDFENFLDWPQVSHRLQRRAISALRLKYKLCSFSERRQLAQWFWQRPFQRRVRMDYNYLNV